MICVLIAITNKISSEQAFHYARREINNKFTSEEFIFPLFVFSRHGKNFPIVLSAFQLAFIKQTRKSWSTGNGCVINTNRNGVIRFPWCWRVLRSIIRYEFIIWKENGVKNICIQGCTMYHWIREILKLLNKFTDLNTFQFWDFSYFGS